LRDIARLVESLGPLDFEHPKGLSALQLEYLNYYQINFGRKYSELEYSMGTVSSGVYQISAQVFSLPKADKALFLLHGYFDHIGIFGRLIEYGLSRNYTVVSFDLPGHGLSSGQPLAVDSFGDYIMSLQAFIDTCSPHLPGVWSMIAQSTGCSIAMDYLLNEQMGSIDNQRAFEKTVLLAPLLRPRGWWWIRGVYTLCKGNFHYVPRAFAESSGDKNFLQFLREDPLQVPKISVKWIGALRDWIERFSNFEPIRYQPLIIQGRKDRTVDWKYNLEQIKRKFPLAKIAYIAGARHHLANENKKIREVIFNLLDEYLLETKITIK